MRKEFGYGKTEKLKKTREIDALFLKGKWRSCGNLRIISLQNHENTEPKIGVSVSKRYFKKAVCRNRVKRLLRECYRLNKPTFSEAFGNCNAMLFWTSPRLPNNFAEVQEEFLKLCASKR